MTALFGTEYFGFIASAYGVTVFVLVTLVCRIWFTHRQRIRALSQLEKAGFKRGSRANG